MGDVKLRLKEAVKQTFTLASSQRHSITLIPPKVLVLDVEDAHFNFDRCVLLPDLASSDGSPATLDARRVTGLGVIYAALVHAQKNAAQGLFVTGHTDASGAAGHNQTLSEERAQSVSLLLRGRREDWSKLAAKTDAVDDVQTVLKWQHQRAGWDCDPGPVNNKPSTKTGNAIREFQRQYNAEVERAKSSGADTPFKAKIGVDGSAGPETWGAIYDVYMTELMDLMDLTAFSALTQIQQQLKPPPGMKDFAGCGEHIPFNPARRNPFEKGKDEHLEGPQKNPPDRRVEILFFDPGEEVDLVCHPKPGQCTPDACNIYTKVPHRQFPIGIPKGLAIAEVNLQLTFVDPEGKVRPFPEGLPVQAKFGEPPDDEPPAAESDLLSPDDEEEDRDTTAEAEPTPADETAPESMEVDQEPTATVGANGALQFTIPRKAPSLFLRLLPGAEKTFVTADPKNLADQKLATEDEAAEALAAGRVFFQLPAEFNSRQAYFDLQGTPAGVTFKDGAFLNVDSRQTQLGSREAPLELRLSIHWQHFQFEYFDRWTSSLATVPQPRSKTDGTGMGRALVLEGAGALLEANRAMTAVEARSAWEVLQGKNTVHCLAWIRRETIKDQPRRVLPDDKCTTRFRTDRLFVRTDGDGKSPDAPRAFVSMVNDEKPADTPGVERLRLYDLPLEWRSRIYPARIGGETADKVRPFEKVAGTASTLDKPYVVSLDVIVLQATSGPGPDTTVKWDDSKLVNRFTLLDNELKVYKPDPPSAEPYFTRLADLKPQPSGPVLMDFPPFTRLITRGRHVYDVFDRRTRASPLFKDAPVGARLAEHVSVGLSTALPMTLTAAPFAAARPNATNSAPIDIGDSWTGVLRCCGHDGNVELFNVLQYVSVSFDFARPFTPALLTQFPLLKQAVPLTAPPPNAQTLVRDCLLKMADRWNGRDTLNTQPATFEINNPATSRGRYVALLTHGALTATDPINAGEIRINLFKSGRSFMAGNSPEGFWDLQRMKPLADGRFTAAHEMGHVFGQPDEYLNRDDEPSYDQPNIGEDFRSSGMPYGIDEDAMMVHNREPRTRYFWDAVLFAHENGHFADAKAAFVKHGPLTFTTDLTKLTDSRVRFPVAQKTNVALAPFGLCDLFFYSTGRDEFTAGSLDASAKARPYDGFVVVRVKMAWNVTPTNAFDDVSAFIDRAHSVIHHAFNESKPLAVRAKLNGKAVRMRLIFAPRFLCSTFPSGNGSAAYFARLGLPTPTTPGHYQTLVTNTLAKGVHVNVNLVSDGTPGVKGGTSPRQAVVRNDGTTLLVFTKAQFNDDVLAMFSQMVGGPFKRTGAPVDVASLLAALSPELTDVVQDPVA